MRQGAVLFTYSSKNSLPHNPLQKRGETNNDTKSTQLINLKQLIFGEEDKENPNKCIECKQNSLEYCKLADLCKRYGAIFRVEGNIDHIDKLLSEGR